jgi:tyrosinase
MILRKNVTSLTASEKSAYVKALLELKKRGEYDKYVHWHHHIMIPTVLPHEPRDANYRNGAHRGPAFLPWHREFLMQLEQELRTIDKTIAIPYWDWTADAANTDPTKVPAIWGDDFMGGNGLASDEWRVQTGPFAYKNGGWPVPSYPDDDLPGPGLKRQFGNIPTIRNLPTQADLTLALAEIFYDTPPYDRSPFTVGFRNRLEGWVTQRGDSRVSTGGSQLHNRVHLWVGGNMMPMTSPDDPVFFLHHCFVDKVWADWQAQQMTDNPEAAPTLRAGKARATWPQPGRPTQTVEADHPGGSRHFRFGLQLRTTAIPARAFAHGFRNSGGRKRTRTDPNQPPTFTICG